MSGPAPLSQLQHDDPHGGVPALAYYTPGDIEEDVDENPFVRYGAPALPPPPAALSPPRLSASHQHHQHHQHHRGRTRRACALTVSAGPRGAEYPSLQQLKAELADPAAADTGRRPHEGRAAMPRPAPPSLVCTENLDRAREWTRGMTDDPRLEFSDKAGKACSCCGRTRTANTGSYDPGRKR